jgi:hypothetical protein
MSKQTTSVAVEVNGKYTDILITNVDEGNHLVKMGSSRLKDGTVCGVGAFPPKKIELDELEEQRIKNAVFHCINFTSKYMGVCELSGEKLDINDDSDLIENSGNRLINKQLAGSDSFVNFPGGMIQYLEKNQYMMDMANKFFETEYSIIANFEFNNKEFDMVPEYNKYKKYINLNVLRSSGVIDDNAILYRTMPLRYSNTNKKMGVTVCVTLGNNDFGEKFIFLDKLKKYNPELFPMKLSLSLDVPSWLKDDRTKWRGDMIGYLNYQIGEDNYIIDDSLSVYE